MEQREADRADIERLEAKLLEEFEEKLKIVNEREVIEEK